MTTKNEILKAIRRNCLECVCRSEKEVRDCFIVECQLFPFRMAKDPYPPKVGFAKNRDGEPQQYSQADPTELLSPTGRKYYESRGEELAMHEKRLRGHG